MDHQYSRMPVNTSRREFLQIGAVAAAALLTPLRSFAVSPVGDTTTVANGMGRRVLVDATVVQSSTNLARVLHHPEPHPSNPIFTGSKPWEKWLLEVNGRSVFYDDRLREFRMYYGANLEDRTASLGTRYKVCYAASKDGIHFERQNLGQVSWDGSIANNIIQWGENWMRRPNVMIDPGDPDASRRYKMTYTDVIEGGKTAICKAYSRDGIHWRLNGDGKPWFRGLHNSNLLGWDPQIQRYVLYPRMEVLTSKGERRDAVGRSTSRDFVTWTEPDLALAPGPSDTNMDFKGVAPSLYGDGYVGLLWVFERNGKAAAELVYSDNHIEWHRVSPGEMFLDTGAEGDWDSNGNLAVPPIVHEDLIYFYYAGWNVPYTDDVLINGVYVNREEHHIEQGWVENGKRRQWAIGLATIRLDRFVSLRAGRGDGTFTTTPVTVNGDTLFVNADAHGLVAAEVLGDDGQPLPGYGKNDCLAARGDNLRHAITWRRKSGLSDIRGREVRLRFFLADADMYSFWFDSRRGISKIGTNGE